MKRTTLVLAASILISICTSSMKAQLQPGDTLFYTMQFLQRGYIGFATKRDSSIIVPSAKVLFIGRLKRPGFALSTIQNDTVVVRGGSFPAAFAFNLAIEDTMPFYLHGFQAGTQLVPDTSGCDVADSVNAALALLRWGIVTISRTDSAFWTFHQRELGANAKKYFSGNYTDVQVDSLQQSGARVYFMGTKSGGRTAIRGYGN